MTQPTTPSAGTPVHRVLFVLGAPFRFVALVVLGAYRLTFSKMFAPRCKYYPSCSAYAEEAIRERGFVAGVLLAGWRLLRCNPWSDGGIDRVPARGSVRLYDYVTHRRSIREVSS